MKAKIVELKNRRRKIDYSQYVKRTALTTDYRELITEPTIFTYEGIPIIAYVRAPDAARTLPAVLKNIDYQASTRSSGLKTLSRVFGFQPRVVMRRDFCASTSLASTNPEVNKKLADVGIEITNLYEEMFPEIAKKHRMLSQKVLNEWRMPNSLFTSGIINKNNPLKYHFDAGNFNDVCSCMLGFRNGVAGGYLSFPEYDMALEISDNSLSMFDGQKILHGVTPIGTSNASSYRFTVVYYSLKGMWQCEPLSAEIARIRKVKQQRELKRAGLLDTAVVDQHGVREEEQ